jgi:hypothetical protein
MAERFVQKFIDVKTFLAFSSPLNIATQPKKKAREKFVFRKNL